ncbi:MAG: O-antigen ligase family protein [Endomicrobiaceae bacterium]|nr:O-antigen ligase family protein [Endomicrobiaceae bacterium]MDD3053864.1 O-antigen ligase family protein [Endomicrobiaceae bacterium]MDD3923066.1 O-antigen ligase family protein [Endomicrobiaceae bacterium]
MELLLNYLFSIGIAFSHVLGYIFSGLSVFFIYKNWNNLKREKIFLLIMLFLVYGFILSFFSYDKQTSFDEMFNYLASWFPPFVLGYYIVDETKKYKIIIINISIFTVIVFFSILAYYNLFYKEIFGLPLAGSGLYGHINAFLWHISLGAMCVMMSSITLVFLLFKQDLNNKRKIILFVLSVFFVVALFLTGSRGYYLAGFITYSSIFFFCFYKTKQIKIILLFMLLSGLIIGILYSKNHFIQERMQNTSIAQEGSLQTRINGYRISFAIFKNHPIFGVGPRQGVIQKEFIEISKDYSNGARHLHSMYINILADFGIVGIIIFGFLVFFIFKRLIYVYKQHNSLFALALIFCWISVLIGDNFDTVLRGPRVAMDYFWLTGLVLGGTLINSKKEDKNNEK